MPFEKGNNLGGRKKGSQNRSTAQIREAYQRLVESNLDNMSTWLADVAGDDPKQALFKSI